MLAINMRKNYEIRGVEINNEEYKLGQFADDMDNFLMGDEHTIKSSLSEIKAFEHQTGLTVNYNKTAVYRVGLLRHSSASMYELNYLKWTNDSIEVLGVYITGNEHQAAKVNYEACLQKAQNTLIPWRSRNLSLQGKVVAVNALAASLFNYKMMCLLKIPLNVVIKFNQIVKDFLWPKARPKIALKTLQNSRRSGGLQLTDLEARDRVSKITWLKILKEDERMSNIAYV